MEPSTRGKANERGQYHVDALPHGLPASNNQLRPAEQALALMYRLLCDTCKLTHVDYLRRDPLVPEPLVPEPLGITRVASRSGLSRFFQLAYPTMSIAVTNHRRSSRSFTTTGG